MARSTLSGAILVFLTLFNISCVSGLECFECNLNLCSRNTTNTPGCILENQYRSELNNTRRQEIWDEMSKMSGCTEKKVTNCLACTKVITEIRRVVNRANYRTDVVLSKVCALAKPTVEEDTCFKNGPSHARQYICHCFNDLCNSAFSTRVSSLTTLIVLITSAFCHQLSS